jgi:hypothetical protein
MILTTHYCDTSTCDATNMRGYPRNRLKQSLKANAVYCVRFYVNIVNASTVDVYEYSAFFGGQNLDTIKYDRVQITYLTPQIENTPGNFITDTLGWTAVSGTFVATGNERFLVLGNFKSNAATSTISANPQYLPTLATDIYYDDVSCIEVDLPAYCGPDRVIWPGDSVFIGRQPDWALDSNCIWYKLPNMTTPIDTISGIWVKPTATSTYIVRQQLDCSSVKWDTVVVSIKIDDTGLDRLSRLSNDIRLAPNPTSGLLRISLSGSVSTDITSFFVTNGLGQVVRHDELKSNHNSVDIETSDFDPGFYQIHFRTSLGTVTKKFVRTD